MPRATEMLITYILLTSAPTLVRGLRYVCDGSRHERIALSAVTERRRRVDARTRARRRSTRAASRDLPLQQLALEGSWLAHAPAHSPRSCSVAVDCLARNHAVRPGMPSTPR